MSYPVPKGKAELRKPTNREGKTSKAGKELTGFNVDIAENGYVMRCHYEKKGAQGTLSTGYEDKTKVFESARAMIEFLEDVLEGEE